jgi:hypothetical protein
MNMKSDTIEISFAADDVFVVITLPKLCARRLLEFVDLVCYGGLERAHTCRE